MGNENALCMNPLSTRRLKRWLLGLGLLFVVGFVGLNILAYRHAYTMMHFQAGNARTGLPESLSAVQKIKVLLWGVNIPPSLGYLPFSARSRGKKPPNRRQRQR
jgi:hypothetical protein